MRLDTRRIKAEVKEAARCFPFFFLSLIDQPSKITGLWYFRGYTYIYRVTMEDDQVNYFVIFSFFFFFFFVSDKWA